MAYDVYLYMNKDETSVNKLLIPTQANKGNHKYIDWSSKVDVVYLPDTDYGDDGTLQVTSDDTEDKYEKGSGYTSIASEANIVFELLPSTAEVEVADTTYYSSWVAGCDSIVASTITKYYYLVNDTSYNFTSDTTYVTVDTLINGIDTTYTEMIVSQLDSLQAMVVKVDTVWQDTACDECTPVTTNVYTYFIVGTKTDYVETTLYGNFGFDDYDSSTTDFETASLTGYFVYNKRPSFYGKESIQYRIYNRLMSAVRYSNYATITVLCGNEAVGDSSTVFLIPNAFSPNGDGYNDVFEILLPYQYEQHSESSLEVYNRWGTLVYKSSGNQYGIDCPYWDGTSKTSNMLTLGEKLPSGTYFYVYKITFIDASQATKSSKTMKGYVELRK